MKYIAAVYIPQPALPRRMRPKTRDQTTTNTGAAAHFLHSRYVGLIINYVIPLGAAIFCLPRLHY